MSLMSHCGLFQQFIFDKHLVHHANVKLSVQKLPSVYSCSILHISDLYDVC